MISKRKKLMPSASIQPTKLVLVGVSFAFLFLSFSTNTASAEILNFSDLTLQRIDSTLESKEQLLLHAAKAAEVPGTKDGFMPSIEFNTSIKKASGEVATPWADASISVNVYRGGLDDARRRLSLLEVEIANKSQLLKRRELLERVRTLWAALVSARAALSHTSSYAGDLEVIRKLTEKRISAGLASKSDLLGLEIRILRVQEEKDEQSRKYQQAESNFGQILGIGSISVPEKFDLAAFPEPKEPLSINSMSAAESLAVVEHQHAESKLHGARLGSRPEVDLFAAASRPLNRSTRSEDRSNETETEIGVKLTYNLGTVSTTRRSQEQYAHEALAAKLKVELISAQKIQHDILLSSEIKSLKNSINRAKVLTGLTEERAKILSKEFQGGGRGLEDVLEAVEDRNEAWHSALDLEHSLVLKMIELMSIRESNDL